MLAVIGPDAVKSEACQAEREYAFSVCKAVTPLLRKGEYLDLHARVHQKGGIGDCAALSRVPQ